MARNAWMAALLATALVPAAAKAETGAQTLQRLSDVEEIRTLLLNYGRLLDDRKLDAYSQLFAREGEWVGGFGGAKGPANILAMMQKSFTLPNEPASRNYHVLTNIIVDVTGDTATAWSRWAFMVAGPDKKPSTMVGGRYEDDLVREDGRWKFRKRVVVADIPFMDPRIKPAKPR